MKHNNLKTKAYHSNLPAYIWMKGVLTCSGIVGNPAPTKEILTKYATVEVNPSYYSKFNITKNIEETV